MALAFYFHPKGMTLSEFEEIHRLLGEAGGSRRQGACITRASARTAT